MAACTAAALAADTAGGRVEVGASDMDEEVRVLRSGIGGGCGRSCELSGGV